jgi:hypothetical protein
MKTTMMMDLGAIVGVGEVAVDAIDVPLKRISSVITALVASV